MMTNISNLILRWRKLELSNWKPMLHQTLANMRKEAAEFWLHVMGVVLEARNRTDTIRALIQFIEASSLADFQVRLDILKSVEKIMHLIGKSTIKYGTLTDNVRLGFTPIT